MISTDSSHLKLVCSFFNSGSGASTAAFGISFLGPAAAVTRDDKTLRKSALFPGAPADCEEKNANNKYGDWNSDDDSEIPDHGG